MKFKAYYHTLDAEAKKQLAKRAKTPVNYLCQLAGGHRSAGADIIRRLMKADSNITFEMMSP
jgi:hypothetical protein